MQGHQRIAINMLIFGQRLRALRELRQFDPGELALLARAAQQIWRSRERPISESWVRLIEAGAQGAIESLSLQKLEALAFALDVPLYVLAPETSGRLWDQILYGPGLLGLLAEVILKRLRGHDSWTSKAASRVYRRPYPRRWHGSKIAAIRSDGETPEPPRQD